MKKILLGVSLLSVFFSTASIAADFSESDFSGFRVGGGYSSTTLEQDGTETSEGGIKVELGYDINEIVGINLSYETVDEFQGDISSDSGASTKVGVDVGYAFYSEDAFIKPYISLGGVAYSEGDYDDNSVYGGAGVRYQYYNFYVDLGVTAYYLDSEDSSTDDSRFTQTAITIGYKF